MTDEEVTRILAERDGYTYVSENRDPATLAPLGKWSGSTANMPYLMPLPAYLTDRNALARVIGKMTNKEHDALEELILEAWRKSAIRSKVLFGITCSPRIIAEACAAAIREGKEGGGA